MARVVELSLRQGQLVGRFVPFNQQVVNLLVTPDRQHLLKVVREELPKKGFDNLLRFAGAAKVGAVLTTGQRTVGRESCPV